MGEDEEVWDLLAGSAEVATSKEEVLKASPVVAATAAAGAPPTQANRAVGGGVVAVADQKAEPPRALPVEAQQRPRRAVGSRGAHRVPQSILEDPELNAAIAEGLPATHNFEVHRTVWRLQRCGARQLGLQMPEGLQGWAVTLADILRRFAPSVETTTIFGEATFGACCIDDLAARALGVDFLVHYGHSCIVPTDQTTVTTLYVHVEVRIDVPHLVETVRCNFAPEKRLAFMGTVQFTSGILEAVEELARERSPEDEAPEKVPQVKPLGVGEVLGCTSPIVDSNVDAVVFVCDGRFHLESAMIQNPHVKGGFFRYDPVIQTLTRESFAHNQMHSSRRAAIDAAKGAVVVGLILGTLGRQGSSGVLEGVERLLDERGLAHLTVLLSDVSPERLALFEGVDAWVQVACPRLSLDWGAAFGAPLLTPYEAHIAFGDQAYQEVYPMDYYSNRGGPWSNYGTHNGHGGSLGTKFRHLRSGRKRMAVGYEDTD